MFQGTVEFSTSTLPFHLGFSYLCLIPIKILGRIAQAFLRLYAYVNSNRKILDSINSRKLKQLIRRETLASSLHENLDRKRFRIIHTQITFHIGPEFCLFLDEKDCGTSDKYFRINVEIKRKVPLNQHHSVTCYIKRFKDDLSHKRN